MIINNKQYPNYEYDIFMQFLWVDVIGSAYKLEECLNKTRYLKFCECNDECNSKYLFCFMYWTTHKIFFSV